MLIWGEHIEGGLMILVTGVTGHRHVSMIRERQGGRASFKEMTLLKRLPSLADVGNVAAFMASDYAGSMTGTVANMNGGQIVD
jgi:enoyl-[acyl-carrier-protein] reductase (NADH)